MVVVEPASVRTEAVGKLERDARQLMDRATPTGRALYQDAFRRHPAPDPTRSNPRRPWDAPDE